MVDSSSSASSRLHERPQAEHGLREVVSDFHSRGWCSGTSGSFSAVIGDEPLRLLITRAGCDKRGLQAEDLTVVGGDGVALAGETAAPSGEALIHSTIAAVTGAGSVLHTHSVWVTLLGLHYLAEGGFQLTGYEMLKGLAGVDTHQAELFVPVFSNSEDIHVLVDRTKEVVAEWPSAPGFVVAGHGLFAWGPTLFAAKRQVEVLEFLCECLGRQSDFGEPRPGSGVWRA
ncbi:MAG: methylthioribulose 1-phosphate dehydratase [Planctomycetota bacterium]